MDREKQIEEWQKAVRVNKAVSGDGYTWDRNADDAWALSDAALRQAIAMMRSAPTQEAMSVRLQVAARVLGGLAADHFEQRPWEDLVKSALGAADALIATEKATREEEQP